MGVETALIAGAIGLATAGAATSIVAASKQKTSAPQLPAFQAAPSFKESETKAKDDALKRRRAATKTILTGPLGLQDTAANTATKTLLGE